jgi:hypothetical protein
VIYVWSIPDGGEISQLLPPDDHTIYSALGRDGRIAATHTSQLAMTYIWLIPDGRNIARFRGMLAGTSPDCQVVALYSGDDEDGNNAYTIWRIPDSTDGSGT